MESRHATSIIPDQHFKPIAIANKGFPYTQLADHRRFEELVHAVLKQEIYNGSFKDNFDRITLMQGVRERGRDCQLFRQGLVAGLVQCKHSINSADKISRPECIREILKFLLHAVLDPTLLPDPNSFTYYFALSHGLSEPAQKLLDNFSSEVLNDATKIDRWGAELITSNKLLQGLSYSNEKEKIRKWLGQIQVEKITTQDLDGFLAKSSNENLVSTYFQVRHVTDSAQVEAIIERALSRQKEIPIASIYKQFQLASLPLYNYQNYFESLPGSHVKRPETNDALNWILSPIPYTNDSLDVELPIALLAGDAGTGKTVIMKEIYDGLLQQGIPVIALKADRLYAKSISQLEEKLSLGAPLESLFLSLKQEHDKVVLLVDQLDALSKSVSIDTESIDTIVQLIHKLADIDGVRILISCRLYDLNYDRVLKFYKNQKVFKVGQLDKKVVLDVLTQVPNLAPPFPDTLLDLLKIPNHLNVFCKLSAGGKKRQGLKSLNDLYEVLWQEKISGLTTGKVSSEKCQGLLYSVAKTMYEEQRIVVDVTPFSQFDTEITYLQSNGILQGEGSYIQFFHQTFYDYCFSKAFVDDNEEIGHYLNENSQGLNVRSSLRMILTFLRYHDKAKYIRAYQTILFSTRLSNVFRLSYRYRYHLRHLLVELLAHHQTPSNDEKKLAKKILDSQEYYVPFLESIRSSEWVNFAIETVGKKLIPAKNGLDIWIEKNANPDARYNVALRMLLGYSLRSERNKEKYNFLFRTLRKFLSIDPKPVVRFLLYSRSFEGKDRFVIRLLYFLGKWDSPEAFSLYERHKSAAEIDLHSFYRIIEDVAEYDIHWSLKTYCDYATKQVKKLKRSERDSEFDYSDNHLIEKLLAKDGETAFPILVGVLKELISHTQGDCYDDYKLKGDWAFGLFKFNGSYQSQGLYGIYRKLINKLIELAKKGSPTFAAFFKSHLDSDSETIIKMLLHSLISTPETNHAKALRLIKTLIGRNVLIHEGNLNELIRNLISVCFEFWNKQDRQFIIDLIAVITDPRETRIYQDDKRKFHHLERYGARKFLYLKCIPAEYRNAYKDINKFYNELNRKFPTRVNEERFKGGIVGPPLKKQAYEKMNLTEWKNSIKKFNSKHVRDVFSLKGSMSEHVRAFEVQVKLRPHTFCPFIESLIGDSSIEPDYPIQGILALKEAGYTPEEVKRLFKKAIAIYTDVDQVRYLIWCTDYFINTSTLDHEVVKYLCVNAMSAPVDEEELGGEQDEAEMPSNSPRTAAAQRLPYLVDGVPDKEFLFITVEQISKSTDLPSKVALMQRLAYFKQLDVVRTFYIFNNLCAGGHPRVIKSSLWTASHFIIEFFDRMGSYFNYGLSLVEVQPEMSALFTIAWVRGVASSKEWFEKAVKLDSKCKARIVEVAFELFLFDKEMRVRHRALLILIRFLSETDQEIVSRYSSGFLSFTEDEFLRLYPFLQAYSKSKVASKSPAHFFEYLLKSAKTHPEECIDLLTNLKFFERPDITEAGHYEDDAPIKVILGVYSALRNEPTHKKKALLKCLKLFDRALRDERFSSAVSNALVEVES